MTHMSDLGAALSQYATDNDDRLPNDKWMDRLTRYVDTASDFRCPAVKAPGYGYAMRESLLGQKLKQIPKNEVLVYDSTSLERNAVGDIRRDFATRHHDKGTVLFADGHTDYKPAAAFSHCPLWPE
jgi:prepilin-type processing-associated H-X9-DG protein